MPVSLPATFSGCPRERTINPTKRAVQRSQGAALDIELTPSGVIDRRMRFDDYLVDENVKALRDRHYRGHHLLEI